MIYVLIPAHNEAATVGVLLWKVRQVFTAFAREYQLVVVDDGSTDATAETLAPYARALPLTVLSNRRSAGYAACLDRLFRAALERTDRPRRDLAVTLQGDFSDAPDDIPELIRRLEGGADLVVTTRGTGAPARGLGRLSQWVLPRALRATLGITGAEAATGTLRGYRLGVIERLVRERGRAQLLDHTGRSADVELLVRTARHARRVEVVPAAAASLPAQRAQRADALRDAWRAWRTALALRALAHTTPQLPPPGAREDETSRPAAEQPTAGDAESSRRRGGRGGRGGRGRRRGRGGARGGPGGGDGAKRASQPPTAP